MATKKEKEAAAKKRKGGTAAPKAVSEEAVLGTISIPVQAWIDATSGPFDELVIEWGCLGLSEEPDSIVDTSGNSGLLDPKRPPKTDEEGLHIYFHPPVTTKPCSPVWHHPRKKKRRRRFLGNCGSLSSWGGPPLLGICNVQNTPRSNRSCVG
jgi:hypothetical protein